MTSDSDFGWRKTIILYEDNNESASSEYVPCINYPNDKVYPEDEKNGWVRLDQDTGPPNVYRFEGSCQNYMDLNEFTPGAVFDEFFEDRNVDNSELKILINMFIQNSDKQKTMGTKILLNC